MSGPRLKSLTAYFLWGFITHNIIGSSSHRTCEYKYMVDMVANCSSRRFTQFPNDLKSKIDILILSANQIRTINDNTFDNLKSIKELYLDYNSAIKISSRAFAPLTELEILDLSYNTDIDLSETYLPNSLVHLYLNDFPTITLKLPITSLQKLKVLTIHSNNLDRIPSFEGNLPSLELLDLSENQLNNFALDSIAGLCNLKTLYISPTSDIRDNCECLRLKEWVRKQNIAGAKMICKQDDQKCNTSPSEAFLKTYDSCKSEAFWSNTLRISLKVVGICGAILAICFSCVVLYVCCNRKNYTDDTFRAYLCCRKRKMLEINLDIT